jgi:hypothetical protein
MARSPLLPTGYWFTMAGGRVVVGVRCLSEAGHETSKVLSDDGAQEVVSTVAVAVAVAPRPSGRRVA